jgi:hypothetical protein
MDDVSAEAAQEPSLFIYYLVQAPGDATREPLGKSEIEGQEGHLFLRRLQDSQETVSHFILGVLQRLEIAAHSGGSDYIEGEPAYICEW